MSCIIDIIVPVVSIAYDYPAQHQMALDSAVRDGTMSSRRTNVLGVWMTGRVYLRGRQRFLMTWRFLSRLFSPRSIFVVHHQ